MPAYHHTAVRVSDIERAATFYQQAFEAQRRTEPFTLSGEDAEMVFQASAGTEFKVCLLTFDDITVELFEFVDPRRPTDMIPAFESNMMHFGLLVEDVDAATDRVIAAGGKRFWPKPNPMGQWRAMYVTDPDNNVIELLDATVENVLTHIEQTFIAGRTTNSEPGDTSTGGMRG